MAATEKLKILWGGDVPLAQTFWQYYFLTVIVLGFLGNAMGLALVSLLAVLWAGFMVMPIWRSSDKYQGLPLYRTLAKVAAILVAIGALSNLLNFG